MYYNTSWTTICNFDWTTVESKVVCDELGFGQWGMLVDHRNFGKGGGPIKVNRLHCSGTENQLSDCSRSNNVNDCTHSNDVSIVCTGKYL